MVGTTVTHYRILEHLGGGGMGVVYKAQDLKLDRPVALKFLPPALTRDPEAKERFIHEAKAASSLQHNNICTVHDIDQTDDGQVFIVMDLYDGETLEKQIERGALPIDQAVEIALHVAAGLSRSHEAGIIHRDIKPANIMVTKRGEVKIVDFGLAKLAGRTLLTQSGTTLGTVAYMSPEQANSNAVDKRTDIWSLGVVLYEMLTGTRPFESNYEQALVYSILNQEPRPVRVLRPEVPEAIEKICRRAMAKDPEHRYKDAPEFIADLESYKGGMQLSEKTRSTLSKKGKLVYAGTAVIVVVIAAAGLLYTTGRGGVYDRVAVLPFHNLSKDSTQEYLADGMTEEVIARLQHVSSLNVPSIRGTMKFKNSQASYADIARELRATAIVDASILSVGNRVRIIAKLIDPVTDRSLWSETYDGSMDEILDLQSRIAQALVRAVRVEVTHAEAARLGQYRKVVPKAYELYLMARQAYHYTTPSEQKYKAGLDYLDQAIAIDSTYVGFYSLEVMMYRFGATYLGYYTSDEVIPRMQKAVQTIISIDDQSSDSQVAIALFDETQWDWDASDSAFRRALELSPGDADIHRAYSGLLLTRGYFDRYINEVNRALEIDPSLDAHGAVRVNAYLMSGRFDEGIRFLLKDLQEFPDDPILNVEMGWAYGEKRMCDSSLFYVRRSLEAAGTPGEVQIALNDAQVYTLCGQNDRARELLGRYLTLRKEDETDKYWVAATYATLGDTNNAFAWLEGAYRARSQGMALLKIDRAWDGHRANPRYRAILSKIRLDR